MSIFFLLLIILFWVLFVNWLKNKFWRSIPRRRRSFFPSFFARERSASASELYQGNTEKTLSVKKLARDRFKKSPHSIAMQRRALVNPRILENKLAEMQNLLDIKDITSTSANQRESTDDFLGYTSSDNSY